MSKVVFFALALSACATGGVNLANDSAPRAGVRLDLDAPAGDATSAFPAAIDTRVRAVDRMAHAIKARFGGATMTAKLALCVAPDGHVTKLSMLEGSSDEVFDQALLSDVAAWQFASLPGPATVESCRKATVAYRAY